MWTKNFHMYKLDLEKVEQPKIKLPTSVGSQRREFQKNIYFCFVDYTKVSDCIDHNKLETFWRYGSTKPPYLPPKKSLCRSRSNSHNQTWNNGWFKIGKGILEGYILSPCLFNLYAVYIMQNAGLDEAQAGIKIAKRNINNLRFANDTTLMAKAKN